MPIRKASKRAPAPPTPAQTPERPCYIYCLERIGYSDRDELQSCVVIARNETDARAAASDAACTLSDKANWRDPSKVNCNCIGTATAPLPGDAHGILVCADVWEG